VPPHLPSGKAANFKNVLIALYFKRTSADVVFVAINYNLWPRARRASERP
jgi:hypothetical protein